MRTICDGLPASVAVSGGGYASACARMSSAISENTNGDGSPLIFADVETIGFPYASINS